MEEQLEQMRQAIEAQCRGWSGPMHWLWQKQLFSQITRIHKVCILGVYFGRDTAYAAALLEAYRGDDFHITAVDLFSEAPCEDWPEELKDRSWEDAGFGPAPTLEQTRQNLEALGLDKHVSLVRADGVAFLEETSETFDLIYIDTSHDYQTTRDTIAAALPRLGATGILAGDDYEVNPEWGVRDAVREACGTERVIGNQIWFAVASEFGQHASRNTNP